MQSHSHSKNHLPPPIKSMRRELEHGGWGCQRESELCTILCAGNHESQAQVTILLKIIMLSRLAMRAYFKAVLSLVPVTVLCNTVQYALYSNLKGSAPMVKAYWIRTHLASNNHG